MDLEMFRGDTGSFDIAVMENSAPMPLTGMTLWFTVKRSHYDDDAAAFIKKDSVSTPTDLEIVNAAGGTAKLTINSNDTSSLLEDEMFVYDLQLTGPSLTKTIQSGTFLVKTDITRSD